MLGADGALMDVVYYVCIDAGPVDCLSCLCLHFLHPLVGSMQVTKGTFKEFWGNKDRAFLEEEACLYGQLILGAPDVSGDPQDLLLVIWPYLKGEVV